LILQRRSRLGALSLVRGLLATIAPAIGAIVILNPLLCATGSADIVVLVARQHSPPRA
jgi:hypothetical protein